MTFDPEQLGQPKQELAALLKELRKRAGLTGDRLARRCNMSQSKISRIENGKARPSLLDLERILRAVVAPPEVIEDVIALARLANTEWQDLRSLRRRGLEKKQTELAALESSSAEFRFFLLSMITGLLSTPEYIRASLAHSPTDVTRTIARKLERQEVLYDTKKRFTFLLTEQAVRWPLLPPAAMAMQIDRLASLTYLPNVKLGVIPMAGYKSTAPMDTFTVYDDALATVENTTGVVILRDPRDIEMHLELFSTLEGYALFGAEARALLAEWAAACRS
ncbi:helix-turn-helix domain-containing protein [Streptomyces sp. SID8366]|uniref:helix-turn-helix domain-containing protein n=1 Tax=unclassified Streptomyces TaxID=2593676 RepID=UPI000DBA2680|nr:helix-turn-helix transcriptional regulator [Streptomyces sp. PsTaAH-130]MYU05515.1 helix-turn-helix domain-containing protein [Streptomyces sp. SID8366]MYU63575.1 helix-turn-helix domain-containing protein [Streptomyces sp. SID69]